MWIITSIGLNSDLALNLRGSHVEAKANIFALEALVANHIRSHINKGLFIQSSKNISLSAINAFQKSSLVLDEEGATIFAKRFDIKDENKRQIVSTSAEKTTVGSKKLEILGDGGQAFKSGIETQMIRAGPGNSLGVVSPTGRLNLNGPQKINLGSFAGPINVQALNHIHLRARRGNITIDSSSIRIPSLGNSTTANNFNAGSSRGNLRLVVPLHGSASLPGKRRNKNFVARQLCACHDGKLFTAKSSSHCVANYQICPD